MPHAAERHFISEHEFAASPKLAARQDQVVILKLEPATSAQETLRENVARFQMEGGPHNFCLDKNDSLLTNLTLENNRGQVLVRADRTTGCVEAVLPPGIYQMRIWHDGGMVDETGRVAFLQVPNPGVWLTDADGRPRDGYWALQPDPSVDPTGQGRQGRLRATPPRQDHSNLYPQVVPVMGDWTSQQIDEFCPHAGRHAAAGNAVRRQHLGWYAASEPDR